MAAIIQNVAVNAFSIAQSTLSSIALSANDVLGKVAQANTGLSLWAASTKGSNDTPVAVPANKPRIANFQVLKPLGAGGFGSVFLTKSKKTGDFSALKVIHKHRDNHEVDATSVFAEQAALKVVSGNPFFLNLEESFHDSYNYYFVTNFLAGGTLCDRIRPGLTEADIRFYFAEIVYGVSRLHSMGLMHRDIKPENILLDSRGHVVISDFGLSHMFDRSSTAPHFLKGFCGTPGYIAPEMWALMPYSYQLDVFALGVLLYTMLFGELPFKSKDMGQLRDETIMCEPAFSSKTRKSISPSTMHLLRAMLNKFPQCRPPLEMIKNYPFFTGVNWKQVAERSMPAPWVPQVQKVSSGRPRAPGEDFIVGTPYNAINDPAPAFTFIKPRITSAKPRIQTATPPLRKAASRAFGTEVQKANIVASTRSIAPKMSAKQITKKRSFWNTRSRKENQAPQAVGVPPVPALPSFARKNGLLVPSPAVSPVPSSSPTLVNDTPILCNATTAVEPSRAGGFFGKLKFKRTVANARKVQVQ